MILAAKEKKSVAEGDLTSTSADLSEVPFYATTRFLAYILHSSIHSILLLHSSYFYIITTFEHTLIEYHAFYAILYHTLYAILYLRGPLRGAILYNRHLGLINAPPLILFFPPNDLFPYSFTIKMTNNRQKSGRDLINPADLSEVPFYILIVQCA